MLRTVGKREYGRKTQIANINAAIAVSNSIKTTLGPLSMMKMVLNNEGNLMMTNDGHAILKEI